MIALRIETSAVRKIPFPTDSNCEISIAIRSPDTVLSSPSRSPSPWSDMSAGGGLSQYSGEDRDDFEMSRSRTESPASSYAELEQDVSAYDCPPSPIALRSSTSTRPRRAAADSRVKTSHSAVRTNAEEKVTRAARARSLKLGLKTNSVSPRGGKANKTPAPEHQREVLRMIFDDITPYPDEIWISKLAVHFDCGYDKIKNWFSNTRQKDALLWRLANPSITDQYNLASTLLTVHIEGREMKLRPQALEHCKESDWSDEFFYQVVLVNDWKMVGKVREMKLREEAAYGLLELRLRGLP